MDMTLLDKTVEISKRVGETTASVAKSAALAAKEKSEQIIKIGKLRKDILVENGRITKLYDTIGRHAFDIYNSSSKDYALLEPLLAQISAGLVRIEELKLKIEEVKIASDINDDDIPVAEETGFSDEAVVSGYVDGSYDEEKTDEGDLRLRVDNDE